MKLELFKKNNCPYCRKIMKYLEEVSRTDVEMRDIAKEPESLEKLLEVGGKKQVPCLFINGEALYESDAILAWLAEHPQAV